MKKEIIIFGTVVVLCLAVTAFALIKPKAKPTTTDPDSSSSFAGTGSTESNPSSTGYYSDSSGTTGSSDVAMGGALNPPPADLNPSHPFDTTIGSPNAGMPPTSTPGLPPANSFPGGSTSSAPGVTTISPPVSLDPVTVVADETRTHEVKKGDVLSSISKQYYGSSKHWKLIRDANSVQEDGLKPGMKLTIPPLAAPASATGADAGISTGADAGTYVVKKGDSYYKIAKQELGDASRFKELEKLNGIAAEDLNVGMKITLPARAGGTDLSIPGPEAPAGGRIHVVADGEYLSDISKKYYGSTKHWQEIVQANAGVSPERLKVGQKLVIPELAGKSISGSATPDLGMASDEYVVLKGDTFEVIAGKILGDKRQWKKIQDVNPGVDPSRLKIGQKIKVPAGATGIVAPTLPEPPLPSPNFPAPTDPFSTSPTSPNSPLTPSPAPAPVIPGPSTPITPAVDPWATPLPAPSPASPS